MSEPTPPSFPAYEILTPIEAWIPPPPPRPRYRLHALLLLATVLTTLVMGARLEYNFLNNQPAFSLSDDTLSMFPLLWALRPASHLLLGVPFAATLMFILLAHEMGHYVYCKHYRVWATPPFFIPAPTLIGTLGAFIRIKSPIRSRAALFDIGIAGPIAGFIVATVTLLFSLTLSKPMPPNVPSSDILLGYPLIFQLLHRALVAAGAGGPGRIPLHAVYLHPTALAAWVGMFATALNLLPGGQLDGGHIVYAVSPRAHRYVSRITIILLLVASWWWGGWLVWALLLRISGMRHPQVALEPGLSPGRRWLFVAAIIMLALTFMLAPFSGSGLRDLLS
jgi:membrane-associated protease RseP (regulator of RpoE activity)